jgi:hypothetical protein
LRPYKKWPQQQNTNKHNHKNNTLFYITELLYMIFCFTAFTATKAL